MIKVLLTAVFIIALAMDTFANKDQVVAKVGKEEITFEQLEKAFQKNMNRKADLLKNVSQDSVMNFIKLYTNYRLKVLDALDRGYENDSAVKADIQNNRKTLADNFYFEQNLLNPTMDYYMKHRKRAVKFAYMLFTYNPLMAQQHYNSKKPMPDDSAWINANMVLAKLKKGEDFGELSKQYSMDKETAKNGGAVNSYITIGKLQRDLDQAIFAIKKGEYYPEVVKTSYGYFLLKILDDEPRILVRPSHILITTDGKTKEQAKQKADSLLNEIRKGANFAVLAEKNSDDASSGIKGGDMGDFYGRTSGFEKGGSMLINEFVDALMKLKDGEVSGVIETPYGYHIIKRDSSKSYNQEADLDDVKKLYKRLHYEDDKRKMIDSLTVKYGFAIEEAAFAEFKSILDSTKTSLDSNWAKSASNELKRKTLFRLKKLSNTVGDFIETIKKTPKYKGTHNTDDAFRRVMKQIVEPMVMDEATKYLEKENPDFAALAQEFHDGMLLFKVESVEVWDKLKFDSTKAKVYWDTTKTRYMTNIAYNISEIFVISDSASKDIKAKIDAGENFEELAAQFTVRNGYREKKGNHGSIDSKRNKFGSLMTGEDIKEGKIVGPKKYENGFSILKINKVEPVRQKTFNEAIPDFAPAFQDQQQKILLNAWLDRIQGKHKVIINDKAINKILNK